MSSVTDLFPNTAYIAFLQLLTNRFHTAQKWGAAGGLNFHLIPRWIKFSSIPSLFHTATYVANFLAAATKVVILSLMIILGLPVRALNFMVALRQVSVSNLGTTSICTALIVGKVNRQHHRFSFFCSIVTVKGPKKWAPTFVKAVEASNRSSVISAITGVIVCALQFLQVTHMFKIDLKAYVCLWSKFSAEQCFFYAQCLRVVCPGACFARIIQLHDAYNVAILDALHWSPIDFT